MKRLAELITRSAERLAEGVEKFEETKDPMWLWFLRRESSLLVKRAIKFWVKIRLKRFNNRG